MSRAPHYQDQFGAEHHAQVLEAQTAALRTECERLRTALACIRDGHVEGMSPAIFAERVLRGAEESH